MVVIVTKVFWDANLFIYLFERNATFFDRVSAIRKSMLARGDLLFTSALTVGEILVKPSEAGLGALLDRYRAFFKSPAISVVNFDLKAAELYAAIRRDRSIARTDAIQLACAGSAEMDLFITNDDRLSGKFAPGIKFITSLTKAPL
jgi:predicted nucleic acid-binding protein